MRVSLKKLSIFVLIAFLFSSLSFVLIKTANATCGTRCWVKRTCVESDKGLDCGAWSGPYDCTIVCDGDGAPSDHGGSGNTGDSGTPKEGPGTAPGSSDSSSQKRMISTQVNLKDCSLESVDPETGKATPICKFSLPQDTRNIFGGIPLTRSNNILNVKFTSFLPTHLRSACTEAISIFNNFFAESKIPLHLNIDSSSPGDITIGYDDPGERHKKTEAFTRTTPPSSFDKLGKSFVTFNYDHPTNKSTKDADFFEQISTCTHEIGHSLGLSDVASNNLDPNYPATMGAGLSHPLYTPLNLDFCMQTALTYILKYGSEAYKKDVSCVGDPEIIKKLERWLKESGK